MVASKRASGTTVATRTTRRPAVKAGKAMPVAQRRDIWAEFRLSPELRFDLAIVAVTAVLLALVIAGLPLGFTHAGPSWLRVIAATEDSALGGGAFVVPALVASLLFELVRFVRMSGPPVALARYLGAGLLLLAWASVADASAAGSGGAIGAMLRTSVASHIGVTGWALWLALLASGGILLFGLSIPHLVSGVRWLVRSVALAATAVAGSVRPLFRTRAVAQAVPVSQAARQALPVVSVPAPLASSPAKRLRLKVEPIEQMAASSSPPVAAVPASLPVIRTPAPLRAETRGATALAAPKTRAAETLTGIDWRLPESSMFAYGTRIEASQESMYQRAGKIVKTLAEFGIAARVQEIRPGPTVTQFGVRPDAGVKVAKIVGLQNDLALALEAHTIRVEAPVPGKPYVGIEVPNPVATPVTMRELIESQEFAKFRAKGARLPVAVGSDVAGDPVFGDLTRMPHLLIAGATGAGKSVFINALVSCVLVHCSPEDVQLIMVDPKQVELTGYNGIPHLKAPVIVDVDKVVGALDWCIKEMERRYSLFAQGSFRDIVRFNETARASNEATLAYIVVIIDELADLMMTAPDQVEQQICRLAQKARATGIHLVLATQRPSVDVITGLIKANFPSRIAFAVSSGVDSKTILDSPGAERLLGRGDMLYTPSDALRPIRVQGTWVSDQEIETLVNFWRKQREAQGERWQSPQEQHALLDSWASPAEPAPEDRLIDDAAVLLQGIANAAVEQGRAPEVTVSLIQRRLRVGQARANLLLDELFDRGLVSAPRGPARTRSINLEPTAPAGPPALEEPFPSGDE